MKKNILTENFSAWEADYKLDLKSKLDEAETDKKDFIIVPVWRLDVMNRNGRVYTKELALQLIEQGKITFARDSHQYTDINLPFTGEHGVKAIGKNPFIKDEILYVECHFVDLDYKEMIKMILEKGGFVGLSSVGYGDIKESGEVCDYELLAYFDFVDTPSAGVYIDPEQMKESDSKEIEETENESADLNTDPATEQAGNDELAESEITEDELKNIDFDYMRKEYRRSKVTI